jgi:hypothetical protein
MAAGIDPNSIESLLVAGQWISVPQAAEVTITGLHISDGDSAVSLPHSERGLQWGNDAWWTVVPLNSIDAVRYRAV